jgi:hypothetical protein
VKRVEYIDEIGRKFIVECPDEDSDPAHGIIVGPPFLDTVCGELPLELQVRLHNELYRRRILTSDDARRRSNEVVSAMYAAFSVDAARVIREAYRGGDQESSPNGVHSGLAG